MFVLNRTFVLGAWPWSKLNHNIIKTGFGRIIGSLPGRENSSVAGTVVVMKFGQAPPDEELLYFQSSLNRRGMGVMFGCSDDEILGGKLKVLSVFVDMDGYEAYLTDQEEIERRVNVGVWTCIARAMGGREKPADEIVNWTKTVIEGGEKNYLLSLR